MLFACEIALADEHSAPTERRLYRPFRSLDWNLPLDQLHGMYDRTNRVAVFLFARTARMLGVKDGTALCVGYLAVSPSGVLCDGRIVSVESPELFLQLSVRDLRYRLDPWFQLPFQTGEHPGHKLVRGPSLGFRHPGPRAALDQRMTIPGNSHHAKRRQILSEEGARRQVVPAPFNDLLIHCCTGTNYNPSDDSPNPIPGQPAALA